MPRKSTGEAASTGASKPRATVSRRAKKPVAQEAVTETAVSRQEPQPEKKAYKVRTELPGNMVVPVKNGFAGMLVYKSRKTGERFVWQAFGDEQDMELQELRAARNASHAYFRNNWFLIDDPEVLNYLGVEKYYSNALTYEEFDELPELSPEEIEERIANLPDGQKRSVAYRAKQLIAEGAIDSIRAINALEAALGTALIER